MELALNLKQDAKKILAAVSGGLDSMCLLHLLHSQRKALGIEIFVVTVNHNLRGEEGALDAEFVRGVCDALDIKCAVENVDVMKNASFKGFNTEAEARKLRYEVFDCVRKMFGCDAVATAHHADDNAETVLLNILRGAGLNGASGIAERDYLIRPLLGITRDELEEYARLNNIKYRIDSTNSDTDFNRNYIRHEIMPRLKLRFPNAVNAINSFSERARIDGEFINSFVPDIDKMMAAQYTADGKIKVLCADLKNHAVGVRVIKNALNALGIYKDISAANYKDILALCTHNKGSVILLKNGVRATHDYDGIVFTLYNDEQISDYELPFKTGVTAAPYGTIEISECDCGAEEFKTRLKLKQKNELFIRRGVSGIWRNRRAGDTFTRMGGTKRINDFFTDIKLSDFMRDTIPLLDCDGEILAVAGIEIAKSAAVSFTRGKAEYYLVKYTPNTEDYKCKTI